MIYLIVFALSLFFYKLSFSIKNKVAAILLVLCAILLPAALAGLRDIEIGTDTGNYPFTLFLGAKYHSDSLLRYLSWYQLEKGFLTLEWTAVQMKDDFNFFLFVVEFIILSFWIAAINKWRVNKLLCLFMLFAIYFSTTMNIMRQSIAMAIDLYAFSCIVANERKKAISFASLAMLFHTSSFIFLLILVFYCLIERYHSFFSKNTPKAFIVILTSVVVFGFSKIIESVVGMDMIDQKYMDRYGSSDAYGSNVPLSTFALNGFNLALFYFLKAKTKAKGSLILFAEYIVIFSLIFTFLANISTYLVRLGSYFTFLNILFLSYYAYRKRIPTFSVIVFYSFYWIMVVLMANLGNTFPYHSKILQSLF